MNASVGLISVLLGIAQQVQSQPTWRLAGYDEIRLSTREITSLQTDEHGRLWVGSGAGEIFVQDAGQWISMGPGEAQVGQRGHFRLGAPVRNRRA